MEKNPKAFLADESGMSLVEVMTASAIMAVLALGMATFISNQHREVKNIRERATFNGVAQAVRDTASTGSAVVNSLSAVD